MGFVSFMRNLLGVGVDPETESEQPENEVTEQQPQPVQNVQPIRPVAVAAPRTEEKRGRTINMQSSSDRPQVILVKPERFEDARTIADHLCAQHTVVLNLEVTEPTDTRRLVDFLSGVAYAQKGAVRRVAKQTFLITPSDIDMCGELVDEVESSGLY